ncbi:hypothetical protein PT974_01225 [Cladobotryum mycophilum]|uniref:Uncharacterized protein n=1 Tax=Cladobotryum mycophilum TaxID=491253 RepID=A0ABR0T4C9_9HYPO
MLSRVALVPRICLNCRLGLTPTRAPLYARTSLSQEHWFRRRYYASDSTIHTKERIEALISGRLVESKFKSSAKKTNKQRGGSKGKRGKRKSKKDEDDLPDWGLALKAKAKVLAEREAIIDIIEPVVENPLVEEPVTEESIKEDVETPTPEQEPEVPTPTKAEPDKPLEAIPTRIFKDDLVQARNLGVEALGQPVEALVVKNPNQMRRPRKPVRMLEEEKMAESIDLHWQTVMPKVEEPDELMDEAVQNIDELRPIDTNTLRIKDFDDLADQLVEGFTYNQLLAYFHRNLPKIDTKKTEIPKYDWVLEQTFWKASQPDHWELLKPKQRYAVMIIKKIWNLDIQEQVEGLGIMQVWVRPDVFQLISQPSSPVLKSLTMNYLYGSNEERIARNVDEDRLDIFARKSIVPVLLARLNEIVDSITSETISVRHVRKEDLHPERLQVLERITSTRILYEDSDAKLEISWLAKDDRLHSPTETHSDTAHQTESPADVVLRLLMGSHTRDQQTDLQILTASKKNESKDALFISHQRERRSMSWKEKLQPWARYVTPIGKQSIGDAGSLHFSDNISLPESSAKTTQVDATNSISATFGHILHSKLGSKENKMAKHARIISPIVPHPAALTPIPLDDKPVFQQTSIILKFAPNPSQATKFKGAIPEVHLKVPVDPDADLANFSFPPDSTLHGVLPWHVYDVLLPGKSVDVRFSQHQLLPLDVNQQSLKDFLAACDFNLLEGRLQTPSQTTFSIPSRWRSATGRSKSSRVVDVAYQFMGLEIHQVAEVDWHGHTLRYNSIEAGQHGGQRQELSLQLGLPQSNDKHTPTQEEKSHFLQLVEEIAAGKHFSWHQGYELIQEASDEDFAFDMLEESTEDYPLILEAEEAENLVSKSSIVAEEAVQESKQQDRENLDGETEITNTDADATEVPIEVSVESPSPTEVQSADQPSSPQPTEKKKRTRKSK